MLQQKISLVTQDTAGPIVFELCAETLQACLAAREGKANRIELCSSLIQGGVTPSHGLIQQAVAQSGLPVHVLLRPRAGDFVYSTAEFALMAEDLHHLKGLGAAGVVLGLLQSDGTVDVERTRQLVQSAEGLEVTFHRAFDCTPSLERALEDVISTGCRRILTSGGKNDVLAGSENLRQLGLQAGERIAIAAGGGLRLFDAAALVKKTGLRHFHGSLQTDSPAQTSYYQSHGLAVPQLPATSIQTLAMDVARMLHTLREGAGVAYSSK